MWPRQHEPDVNPTLALQRLASRSAGYSSADYRSAAYRSAGRRSGRIDQQAIGNRPIFQRAIGEGPIGEGHMGQWALAQRAIRQWPIGEASGRAKHRGALRIVTAGQAEHADPARRVRSGAWGLAHISASPTPFFGATCIDVPTLI